MGGAFDDGTIYLGLATGTHIDTSLEGRYLALYIQPIGNQKFMSGYLDSSITGAFDNQTGTFSANSNWVAFPQSETQYAPSDLLNLAPIVENPLRWFSNGGPGLVSGEIDSIHIEDQTWGLWSGELGGFHNNLPDSGWGSTLFGYNDEQNFFASDIFIYGAQLGSAFDNDRFSSTMSGSFLDTESFGSFTGNFLGTYDESTWQGTGLGTYTETLSLESAGYLYFALNEFSFNSNNDWMYGLTGLARATADPIWSSQNARFVSIGGILNGSPGERFVWSAGGTYAGFGHFVNYTNDGAVWGVAGGVGTGGVLAGATYGLYIDPQGNAGTFSGALNGEYSEFAGPFVSNWQLTGGYLFGADNLITLNDTKNVDDTYDPFSIESLVNWAGLSAQTNTGVFNPGTIPGLGTIQVNELYGNFYRIGSEDWGVYDLYTAGTYQAPTSNSWQIISSALLYDYTQAVFWAGSWLGSINGTSWDFDEGGLNDNLLQGDLNAVWIKLHDGGTLSGRVATGDVVGNYTDVNEGALWQATSTGEWVEVDSLLNVASAAALAADVQALGEAAGVPITEAYSSLLSGQGSFGAGGSLSSVNFFIDFFTSEAGALSGIWAGGISGNYQGSTSGNFTITTTGRLLDSQGEVTGDTVNATVSGLQWDDQTHQWQAQVGGYTNNSSITFDGGAAGTFGDGAFNGAGTGTWTGEGGI